MSSEGQSILKAKPSARRKNTTKACEECRRRRAKYNLTRRKCDGRKPSCSRCTIRGIDCQFDAKEDGRKPASMSYVSLLRDRIRTLEEALRSQSIDTGAELTEFPTEYDSTLPSDFEDPYRSAFNVQVASRDGAAEIEQLRRQFEGTLNLDHDGETHFYGVTSGRLDFLTSSQGVPDTVLEHKEGVTKLTIPSFFPDLLPMSIPDELQLHLIEIYFTWANPWCPVINEELFRGSMYSGGKYCTPLLLMCIFSMGSRFTDRPEVRSDPASPYTAGRLFLEEAERLLQVELKSPKITTIQALTIMSVLYCAFGYDSACWLHEGMASRLMLEMGLNIDTTPLVASDSMPVEEAMLRRQMYWSLYSVDKLSASYTGRACTMLSFQGAVQMPFVKSGTSLVASRQDESMVFLNSQVKLCQIVEEILLNL
ncbi:hypothetical protein D6D04_05313 [Aureobasidium pullulans]|nr:hypothetical protein D6D04_05313 [Aureobasidium pullulans]